MKIGKNLQVILLLLILLAAAVLRLYRIQDFIVFLGDQGRDVLVVKRIIIDHDLTLLGPTASVGGFYLGPIYYYMMILPLWLGGFNPVGPAVMVALFGVATVWLIYEFVKTSFGDLAGLVSALIYAFSPLAVAYSRFSWNPNTLPFFSLLYFYLLYFYSKKKKNKYIFLAGLVLGICSQLHYLGLSLVPLGFALLFDKKIKRWLINLFFLFIGFFVAFSPFILFEFRHGFSNSLSVLEFVTRAKGPMGFYLFSLLSRMFEFSQRIFALFFGIEKNLIPSLLVIFSLVFLIKSLLQQKTRWISIIMLVWWWGGVFIISFYQGTFYDYYFGFLYPIPAIALGVSLGLLAKEKLFFLKYVSVAILAVLIYFSLINQPFLKTPNKLVQQTERISMTVIEETKNMPYNFALISGGNSDHAYRYFLEINGRSPIPLEDTVEEQLLVVCEQEKCEPLGNPLWEIAAFGRAEIAGSWQDPVGIKIYRLVHHPESMDLIGEPAPKY